MARVSPLNPVHEAYGALMAEYGPGPGSGRGILVAQVQRGVGAEYAAIRRAGTGCVIIDQPQRGTIEVRGGDRMSFLNRMVTQELKGFERLRARRTFWLNRKGRIDADMRLIELGERMLVDLDAFAVERAVTTLSAFVIADDVEFVDRTESLHRLGVHGQGAAGLLDSASEMVAGGRVAELQPGQVCIVRLAAAEVIVDRQDSAGEPGFELTVPVEAVEAVFGALARPAEPPGELEGAALREREPGFERKAVRAGWHGYNIARIEAGWAIYMLDFGPDSLPHETGVLEDRVSFTKGCYLGQEVVARMQSLGHPKQKLVGVRIEGDGEVTGGSPVLGSGDPSGEVIGAVTSATSSPMLSSAAVCFAMIKWKHTNPGSPVWILREDGSTARGVVQGGLRFWSRGS